MAAPRRTNPTKQSATPEIRGIAENVSSRRIQLGLTQQTVADLAGVSRSTVQTLGYGRSSISLAAFLAVLDTLGLRADLTTKGSA